MSNSGFIRRQIIPARGSLCLALLVVAAIGFVVAERSAADCSVTSLNTPINDLGYQFYVPPTGPGCQDPNYPCQGGLYPGGSNQRPEPYNTDGITLATTQIMPRDTSGASLPNGGKIVMVSIGMCNAFLEYGGGSSPDPKSFIPRTLPGVDKSLNPALVFVDGAQPGADAPAWTDPNSPAWMNVTKAGGYLDNASVTKYQVQVVWLKEAWIFASPHMHWPPEGFPAHAIDLKTDLENILRSVKMNFPNCQIAYLSPRARAYTTTFHNPEPEAYETGFADKWTIADQINAPAGYIGYKAPAAAPWICWGPYLWATGGTTVRSDGLTWECNATDTTLSDVRPIQADGTGDDYVHPSSRGIGKIVDQLLAFLKTDPTATPWFLKPTSGDLTAVISPSSAGGTAPFTVNFTSTATAPAGRTITNYIWTYDDGDYAYSKRNPTKTFKAPGLYKVHFTAVDNLGNTIQKVVPVTVN